MAIINAKSAESSDTWNERSSAPTEQIILEAELNVAKQELNYHQETMQYQKKTLLCFNLEFWSNQNGNWSTNKGDFHNCSNYLVTS